MKANVPDKWRSALYGQGSRWRCRWYTLRDGKRVQKSRNFAKLRDAEEYAAAIEDDIRRGKYRDPQQELPSSGTLPPNGRTARWTSNRALWADTAANCAFISTPSGAIAH
ncbi:Arm DNA-binding domain-containing protein [Bifidobacterium pseudocatenulatum]|uniref:Arm DNA-binding domain-containing protein n=1 Tax=Bifidobacterium pseudocatenulatum TaxID=28026 RepID=UPI003D2E956A